MFIQSPSVQQIRETFCLNKYEHAWLHILCRRGVYHQHCMRAAQRRGSLLCSAPVSLTHKQDALFWVTGWCRHNTDGAASPHLSCITCKHYYTNRLLGSGGCFYTAKFVRPPFFFVCVCVRLRLTVFSLAVSFTFFQPLAVQEGGTRSVEPVDNESSAGGESAGVKTEKQVQSLEKNPFFFFILCRMHLWFIKTAVQFGFGFPL